MFDTSSAGRMAGMIVTSPACFHRPITDIYQIYRWLRGHVAFLDICHSKSQEYNWSYIQGGLRWIHCDWFGRKYTWEWASLVGCAPSRLHNLGQGIIIQIGHEYWLRDVAGQCLGGLLLPTYLRHEAVDLAAIYEDFRAHSSWENLLVHSTPHLVQSYLLHRSDASPDHGMSSEREDLESYSERTLHKPLSCADSGSGY